MDKPQRQFLVKHASDCDIGEHSVMSYATILQPPESPITSTEAAARGRTSVGADMIHQKMISRAGMRMSLLHSNVNNWRGKKASSEVPTYNEEMYSNDLRGFVDELSPGVRQLWMSDSQRHQSENGPSAVSQAQSQIDKLRYEVASLKKSLLNGRNTSDVLDCQSLPPYTNSHEPQSYHEQTNLTDSIDSTSPSKKIMRTTADIQAPSLTLPEIISSSLHETSATRKSMIDSSRMQMTQSPNGRINLPVLEDMDRMERSWKHKEEFYLKELLKQRNYLSETQRKLTRQTVSKIKHQVIATKLAKLLNSKKKIPVNEEDGEITSREAALLQQISELKVLVRATEDAGKYLQGKLLQTEQVGLELYDRVALLNAVLESLRVESRDMNEKKEEQIQIFRNMKLISSKHDYTDNRNITPAVAKSLVQDTDKLRSELRQREAEVSLLEHYFRRGSEILTLYLRSDPELCSSQFGSPLDKIHKWRDDVISSRSSCGRGEGYNRRFFKTNNFNQNLCQDEVLSVKSDVQTTGRTQFSSENTFSPAGQQLRFSQGAKKEKRSVYIDESSDPNEMLINGSQQSNSIPSDRKWKTVPSNQSHPTPATKTKSQLMTKSGEGGRPQLETSSHQKDNPASHHLSQKTRNEKNTIKFDHHLNYSFGNLKANYAAGDNTDLSYVVQSVVDAAYQPVDGDLIDDLVSKFSNRRNNKIIFTRIKKGHYLYGHMPIRIKVSRTKGELRVFHNDQRYSIEKFVRLFEEKEFKIIESSGKSNILLL